jgi:protein tyrosine/serine phosphatase
MLLKALVTVAILAVSVGAYWAFYIQTYHLLTVQTGVLYRSGNRGIREFSTTISKLHPKTVVPLMDDAEWNDNDPDEVSPFAEEREYLQKHGVRIERIPVKLGGWPSGDDLRKFIAIVKDPANQPVLVHCAQGVRRTGMFVAAYQMSVLGYDKDKTTAAVQTFGHSDRTANDIKRFIQTYDPAKMEMATTLPVTGNE